MYDIKTPETGQLAYRVRTASSQIGKDEVTATMERWEECLRTQIFHHPKITLATGLVLGLVVGVWVKR